MAAIPAWFDEASYLTSKLAQLKSIGNNDYANINQLKVAIEAAGYTTYSHFEQFSLVERTNPNDYFNTNEYLAAKAAALNTAAYQNKTNWTADTVALALQNAGFTSAYDHFAKVGWTENVNPSNAFDISSYLATKAAALNAAAYNSKTDWTAADVQAAFVAAGVDPVAHYLSNGKTEAGVAVTAVPAAEQVAAGVAGTFTLTAGVDQGAAFAGTAGNDTFLADRDINAAGGTGADTLGSLDILSGGAGVDTLKISSENGTKAYTMAAATISGIEKIEIRGSAAVHADVSGSNITGLESISVLKGSSAEVTAANTADIVISGVSGEGAAYGGKNVTVTNEAGGITVGKTGAYAVGAISVTATKQADDIFIDGGSTVTVNATNSDDTGSIKVGLNKAATGAVSVTQNLNADGTTGVDAGNVSVKGGSTVTVNSNITVNAKDESASATHSFGDVTVTGNGKTTAVTVNQNYVETEFTKAAVAVVKELHTVTFKALTAGQTTTVDGLTFKAAKDLTAAEVAQAFANLTAADTQASGGKVANGYFTGALSANFTSGAASGAVVVFAAKNESQTLTLTDGDVHATEAVTPGVAGSAAVPSNNTVNYGTVYIDDNATASITTVTLNGYAGATLGGSTSTLDALTSLSLANSHGAANVTSAAKALNLTVNNVNDAVNLDAAGSGTVKTLNITATGKDSAFGLTAAAAEAVTISGDKTVDVSSGSTLSKITTLTVTGSAGAKFDATGSTTLTAVDTTGTTGTVTGKVDASVATYTGGAGVDNVTLTSTTVSKAVSTGAGDDTVTLASGTTSLAANISAGAGTDTLVMAVADAATASASNVFETKIDGFEKLSLGVNSSGAAKTVDLANLDDINYVISAGASAVKEVFTATFSADTTPGHLSFDGVDFKGVVVGDAAATSLAFVTYYNTQVGATWDAVDNGNGTATFTKKTAGDVTDVVSGDFSTHGMGADVTVTVAAPTTQGAAAATLTLTNVANNGTLELTGAASTTTVTLADATGTADSFNIVTKVDASDLNFGTVAVAGVETVNITATDTTPVDIVTGAATISKATLALSDSKATTVNVTGNSDLSLDLSSATAVTKVDASALTGKLTLTATGTAAATILGGSAADTLTASGSGDTLIGGAGNDILTGADLTTLTGGAGNDTFKFAVSSNVNSYSTITDLTAGDVIQFAHTDATVGFNKSKVVLADTAVFQDYANAAVNALGTDTNDAAWFQYGGATYIVQSGQSHDGVANKDFHNGTDSIIKIVGLVDLSTASYNQTNATLEIA